MEPLRKREHVGHLLGQVEVDACDRRPQAAGTERELQRPDRGVDGSPEATRVRTERLARRPVIATGEDEHRDFMEMLDKVIGTGHDPLHRRRHLPRRLPTLLALLRAPLHRGDHELLHRPAIHGCHLRPDIRVVGDHELAMLRVLGDRCLTREIDTGLDEGARYRALEIEAAPHRSRRRQHFVDICHDLPVLGHHWPRTGERPRASRSPATPAPPGSRSACFRTLPESFRGR